MNVNVKLSLSDEERNTMFRRLTGKTGKGMVSRADVNTWVKEQLERFLTVGSPTTEVPKDEENAILDENIEIDLDNCEEQEIVWVIKQNKLLQRRVNILQHALDTRR